MREIRRWTWLAAAAATVLTILGCGSSATARTGPSSASVTGAASATATTASATVTAAAKPSVVSKVFSTNWTTYHGDAEATGVQATAPGLTSPKKAWTSSSLDGQLYGEPLVANGRVYAATENNTVYAIAANSGKVLWSRHLAKPVPASDLPCGDISPVVGITGTPVIDLKRNEIFVDADTLISGPAASHGVEASHRLYGLSLTTGRVVLSQVAMPNAGEDQLAQLQRPGLALDQGRVVIAYGQNTGDCQGPNGPGHGFVVSIPERGGKLAYWQTGGGSKDRGAVWMGGSAPVVDPHGNVYVASADGYNLGAGQRYDGSDGVLELSPTMRVESNFYPRSWQTLSGADLDLGTGDPTLVDGLVLQVGKTDTAYVLRQGHLGGEEGELGTQKVCSGNPDGGHAVKDSIVYLPCPNGVTAVKVSTRAPYVRQLWTASGAGNSPIYASGLIWSIGDDNAVHGFSPSSGKQVVSVSYGGSANHFPTPTVADGLLLIPGTNQVYAFTGSAGLPPAPTS